MVPGFDIRIQTMLRAMREVILPAIPADQRLARDQATILIGNLKLMADQHDRLYQYDLVELREYADLVSSLLRAAEGGTETAKAARSAESALEDALPVARADLPGQLELATLVKGLKGAAETLLRASYGDGSDAFRRAASKLVMAQSESQIARERTWFRAAGFELDPDALPSLDEVLSGR